MKTSLKNALSKAAKAGYKLSLQAAKAAKLRKAAAEKKAALAKKAAEAEAKAAAEEAKTAEEVKEAAGEEVEAAEEAKKAAAEEAKAAEEVKAAAGEEVEAEEEVKRLSLGTFPKGSKVRICREDLAHQAKNGEVGVVSGDDDGEAVAVLLSKALLSTEIPLSLLECVERLV